MAIEVGTAYLSILPSTSKLAPAIRKELGAIEKTTGASGEASGRSFASRFAATAGSMIGGALKKGAFAAVISGGFLLGAGLKTAADLEQAKIGFETMLGSADKADAMMKQIQDTAAKTPFELPGLTQSAQKMLAFGFAAKDVIPTLTTIGDAAAGLGAGQEGLDRITLSIGQMQAKGKVQSDELLQLTESGIPALKILANEYGVTTAQMQADVTKGIVSSDKAIPALLKGIRDGSKGAAGETAKFGGLMEKQSQSLSGLWSTVKDTVLVGLANALTPLIPAIKSGLAGAIKILPGILNGFSKALQKAVGFTKNFVGQWKAGTGVGGKFHTVLSNVGNALKDGLHAAATSETLKHLLNVAKNVAGWIGTLSDQFAKGKGTGGALRDVLGDVFDVLGKIVSVASAVLDFLSQHATLVAGMATAWVGLVGVMKAFDIAQEASKFANFGAYLLDAAGKIKIVAFAQKAWTAVVWLFNAAMDANPIMLVVIAVALLVAGIIIAWKHSETFRNIVLATWGAIKGAAVATWNFVKDLVVGVWNALKSAASKTGSAIKTAVSATWNAIKSATSATWNAIKAAISGVWGAIKAVVSAGVGAVKAYIAGVSAVIGIVRSAFDKVRAAISDRLKAAVAIVRGLPGQITGALGDLGGILLGAGRKIMDGLIQGLNEGIEKVKGLLHKVTGMIPGWKGPPDTDRKLLIKNGHLIMEGLLQGLQDGTKKVKALLLKVTKDLPKGKVAAVLKAVKDEYASGLAIAAKIKAITARIETAKTALTDAISLRDNFLSSTRDAAQEWGRALDFDSAKPIDTKALVSQMQQRLDALRTFRTNLATLLSDGIDPTTYQSLVEKGVEAGGALAAALVQDPAAVSAIGDLGRQIDVAANGLGVDSSQHLFQAGVDSSQALLDGLQLDKAKLTAKADHIAREIAKAIKDALKLSLSVDDLLPGGPKTSIGDKGGKGGKGGGTKKKTFLSGVKVYDQGGVLEPGTLAFNASQKPEAVFNERQFAAFAARTGDSSEDRVTKVFNYYAAEGSSLGSEEDLFAAVSRSRMNGW